jgi:hypothetical protein
VGHRGNNQRPLRSGDLATGCGLLASLTANAELRPGIGSQPRDVNVIATMIANTEVAVVYPLQGGEYFPQQPGFTVLHTVGPFTGCPRGDKISIVFGVSIVDMDFQIQNCVDSPDLQLIQLSLQNVSEIKQRFSLHAIHLLSGNA